MKHRFDQEDKVINKVTGERGLTLRQYLNKKQSSYLEAGEENKDTMLRRLHEGLDPTLKITVKLGKVNTIEGFMTDVYSSETSAKDQSQDIQKMVNRAEDQRELAPNNLDRFLRQAQYQQFPNPAATFPEAP
jgi:hypothetical protein